MSKVDGPGFHVTCMVILLYRYTCSYTSYLLIHKSSFYSVIVC